MKKKILQFIGDAIIILACSIPAGFLIEQYNEGYNYYFNLFIHESEPQLLTTSTWYILRCWQIRGCTSAVIVLLMSVYSMIIKANSRKTSWSNGASKSIHIRQSEIMLCQKLLNGKAQLFAVLCAKVVDASVKYLVFCNHGNNQIACGGIN